MMSINRIKSGRRAGHIEVRAWTEAEFLASRSTWTSLLDRSSADPLFMSWEWVSTWWRHHRPLLDQTDFVVLCAYEHDTLIGLVPVYLHHAVVRRPLKVRRLEIVGNTWRDPAAAFSEYLDVIAARGSEADVIAALQRHLASDRRWHEFVLAYVPTSGAAAMLACETLGARARVRSVDPLEGRRVELPASFDEYLAQLSSDTRRKFYNHRRRFPSLTLEHALPENIPAYLDDLHRLRATRWGEQGGSAVLRAFQRDVAAVFASRGALRLSRLMLDGQVLSVLFDLRAGRGEYYLQSGFDAGATHGLSPGYLHLGYAIERSIADGLDYFDLLGGGGVHRDYKSDLRAARVPMTCLQIVRAPWLRALHWAHERLRGGPDA
jgi:CelD/BcsL family acetyltransferase involved in cellulose biosynthesis